MLLLVVSGIGGNNGSLYHLGNAVGKVSRQFVFPEAHDRPTSNPVMTIYGRISFSVPKEFALPEISI